MNAKEPWRESMTATTPSPPPAAHSPQLMTALFGQFGIASIRAAAVDLGSMDMQSSWSLSAHKEPHHEAVDAAPDSAFIAARDAGASLRDAPPEYTMVRKLSPRVWSFAWRASPERMVIAEARYRDRRDALDDTDTALVRLIFLSFAQPAESEGGQPSSVMTELEWPAVERRRGRNWRSQLRTHRFPILLLGLSVLLALWLAVIALPSASELFTAQKSDAVRLQAMADKTIAEHLAAALATGDYGDLQTQLSSFHTLGYFPRAVVLNARQRVVASAGMGGEAVIGAPVPAAMSAAAKAMPLLRGTDQVGQLLTLGKAAETPAASLPSLWALALASALAAMGAAAILLLPARWRSRAKG